MSSRDGSAPHRRAPPTVQEEIGRTHPFASPGREAVAGLLLTTDRVRRRLRAVTEPFGITLQQYNVLRILRSAAEDGLQTLAVAERMVEQTPGITRLLDRLEGRGWVERWRTPGDRRCVVCRLTSGGLALLDEMEGAMRDVDDALVDALSVDELEALSRLLDRVREAHRGAPADTDVVGKGR